MDQTARGVLDIARSVLGELDVDLVLNRVLDSARELTGARYAALGVLSDSRTELERFLTLGIDEAEREAIGSLPRGRGVLGELIAHPHALRLTDISHHPRSYGFPHGHPPMKSFLGVPILIDGTPFGNLYLTEKQHGEQFSEADEEAVTMLAELAGYAIDHARRYTGASQDRDELQRTVAALNATTQIARAVGAETDLDVILELVAKRGRALVDARLLAIELVRQGRLVIAAGAGELPPGLLGQKVPLGDSVASTALRTRRSQRLEEPLTRARFDEHGLGTLGVQAQGGLIVPLVFQNHSYGVLIAIDRLNDGPEFTVDDERLLEAFAASAATAVATAQSVASERRRQRLAAAESERQRWARELHDDTLQSLSALRVGLSTAKRSGKHETLEQAVASAIDHLEEGITNLRALITDLRPASLDELGAAAAIQALCERAERQGLDVDVSIDLAHEQGRERERHIPEIETAMYRIVQEALTNAAKHGRAKRAVVEVHEDGAEVSLSVRDDGSGFDPSEHSDGFGLVGMNERVQLLEGTLEIDSAPGAGTTVRARFPVQRRSESIAEALSATSPQ
ncbi:MAG TPA: GAF domain-containing sensor histidine kinase [Solirubrobacteraceae bacterium]|jgi:signal transduction histidine kinase|nr:GAF domain-containing sensor histidine kinase [Solirubrobacteraceae bacterium]